MQTVGSLGACAQLLLFLTSCASGPSAAVSAALHRGALREALAAYDRGRPDPALLRSIALASLERAARSPDAAERGQAIAASISAGKAAEPVLVRFVLHGEDAVLRARALLALAQRGDSAAKIALRAKLDATDSEVRATAIATLDPGADTAVLAELCESPAAAVRLAAAKVLLRAPASAQTRLVLERIVAHDPEPDVRVAALLALARQGAPALDAIEARLDDGERSVRATAIDVLAELDLGRAAQRLERYLGSEPSVEGVEAARVLLARDRSHRHPTARAQLARALADRDGALRAQAAVALMSLRDPSLRPLAAGRADQEHVRGVRLCLAVALGADTDAGRGGLTALMAAQDVVSGEAAAELARHGDAAAVARLRSLLRARDAVVRKVAVRALAHDLHRGHYARSALLDADPTVRIAAAAAMVSG